MSRPSRLRSRLRSLATIVSASASSTERRSAAAEQAVHQSGLRRSRPEPRPDRHDVGFEREDALERQVSVRRRRRIGQRERHVLGRHRGDDRHRRRRGRDRHQPGAGLDRGESGEVGGARLPHRSGDHQDPSVVTLVRLGLARLEPPDHLARRDDLEPRTVDALDDFAWNADVGDDDLAAAILRWRQHVGHFRRRERHGQIGLDGLAHHVRCVGRKPARDVHRHHAKLGSVEIADDRLVQPFQRTAQAGPEQRIDDQSTRRDVGEVQIPLLFVGDFDDRVAEPTEDLQVDASVSPHVGDAPDEKDRGVSPACSSVRATTKPSPPLLPVPQRTATRSSGRSSKRCWSVETTCRPAHSISTGDGIPISSIVTRSASRICWALRTRMAWRGDPTTVARPRPGGLRYRTAAPYA